MKEAQKGAGKIWATKHQSKRWNLNIYRRLWEGGTRKIGIFSRGGGERRKGAEVQ